ncbi:presenilin family intramembrane aspartyl protease PSH [Halomarina salina]|uniref:Presenilin family intramembrane aspartyl protease PSH n=1 Tax=Halomarina salina TaxID=1872699 RepID=A0ABD5RGZ0_9EURY|nr:presenilin family intramembrane aspartyl protease PSH [Halomarina salina]
MRRSLVAAGATLALFLVVQLGALLLANPFVDAGYQTVENPSDPTNSIVYVGAILVATAFMLAAFKFDADVLIRALVIFSSTFLAFYALSVVLPAAFTLLGYNGPAVLGALVLAVALVVHPEWYVIDAVGVLMGMGAAALFGISFGLLPALILLTVLAVYDAVSVYGTEHMLSLASGVMDLKVPVVLVVPLTWSYSYLDEAEAAADGGDGGKSAAGENTTGDTGAAAESEASARERPAPEDRDAFYIGLGDAVMPTVLVVSAGVFLDTAPLVEDTVLTLPALTALVGTLLGLLVLVRFVMRGRAHAGLPLLNGGAIAGYLLGALVAGVPLLDALGLAEYL